MYLKIKGEREKANPGFVNFLASTELYFFFFFGQGKVIALPKLSLPFPKSQLGISYFSFTD